MRIAIHDRPGSFSDGWIAYCQAHGIPFRRVDCLSSEILGDLADCDALLWHWRHSDQAAQLFARQLALALAKTGIRMFPNAATAWHYDDKVGQKYLFEAIGAPLVPTQVFYDQAAALAWVETAAFPLVFKLRCGAGAANVRLVSSRAAATRLVHQAFGRGFPIRDDWALMRDDWRELRWMWSRKQLSRLTKHFIHGLGQHLFLGGLRERGYVYFQKFLPGNEADYRVVVIGKRAFGMRRLVREGDFRASGSGLKTADPGAVPPECVKLAFRCNAALGCQSVAFDFLKDATGNFLVSEISYAFTSVRGLFPGYWDDALVWHPGDFDLTHFMIEDLIAETEPRMNANRHE